MNPLMLDLRQSMRALLRAPGFLAALVLSLALGVGANTAVFSVLRASIRGHVPWQEPERLVLVGRQDSQTPQLGATLPVSWPRFQHWQDQHAGLEALEGYAWADLALLGEGAPRAVAALRVTDGFFRLLGARPLLGRLLAPGEADGAVLSYEAWQRTFQGNAAILGRSLNLGGHPVTVVGILPRGASWGQIDLFMPLRITPEEQSAGDNWIAMVGRMPGSGSLAQTREALAVMSARLAAEDNPDRTVTAVPRAFLAAWFGKTEDSQRFLSLAALFILALASLNVAVLLLGRGTARLAELGLREALGARRLQLYLPLLVEALVAALPGIGLAFLFAQWAQGLLEGFVPGDLQAFHGTGWTELAFAAGLALVLVVLCATLPAFLLIRSQPGARVHGGRSTSDPRHRRISQGLVALQVACALALLAGFALIHASLRQLQRIPTGFDGRRCVVARVDLPSEADPARLQAEVGTALERLRALPGVAAAAATNLAPGLHGGWNGSVAVPGLEQPVFAWLRTATPGYFHAMGIPMRAGRDFQAADLAPGAPAVIVSESFARDAFPGRDAIGGVLRRERELTVVGVVGDVAVSSLGDRDNRQTLYLPGSFLGSHLDLVVAAQGGPGPLVAAVRRVTQEAWPMVPLGRVAPLPDLLKQTLRGRTQEMALFGVLAGLALAITAAGLFGVLSRDVQERRRELGIRMALGATPESVLALILRRGMAVTGLGLLLGLGGSAGMAILLRSRMATAEPQGFGAHLLAALLLLATALLACLIPALRAARTAPAEVLRGD